MMFFITFFHIATHLYKYLCFKIWLLKLLINTLTGKRFFFLKILVYQGSKPCKRGLLFLTRFVRLFIFAVKKNTYDFFKKNQIDVHLCCILKVDKSVSVLRPSLNETTFARLYTLLFSCFWLVNFLLCFYN